MMILDINIASKGERASRPTYLHLAILILCSFTNTARRSTNVLVQLHYLLSSSFSSVRVWLLEKLVFRSYVHGNNKYHRHQTNENQKSIFDDYSQRLSFYQKGSLRCTIENLKSEISLSPCRYLQHIVFSMYRVYICNCRSLHA